MELSREVKLIQSHEWEANPRQSRLQSDAVPLHRQYPLTGEFERGKWCEVKSFSRFSLLKMRKFANIKIGQNLKHVICFIAKKNIK